MAEAVRRSKKGGLSEETLEFETSEDVDVTPTFDSLGLREELLRGIYAYGEWERNEVGQQGSGFFLSSPDARVSSSWIFL